MDTRNRRKDITSIQVDLSTRDQLDKLANRRREPYNDIIVRLIESYNERELYADNLRRVFEKVDTDDVLLKQMRKLHKDTDVLKLLEGGSNTKHKRKQKGEETVFVPLSRGLVQQMDELRKDRVLREKQIEQSKPKSVAPK